MNLIVAVDKNWGIGCGGELLARIPEDMKYFREKTLGKTVVMGRKTFESLPNGALRDRENIVATRNKDFSAENTVTCCINNAITFNKQTFPKIMVDNVAIDVNDDDIFVIGGESIYRKTLPYCNRAYVTKIDAEFPADRFMENLDLLPEWVVENAEKMSTQSGIDIEFVVYIRN